jgi:WD40 repeat protein
MFLFVFVIVCFLCFISPLPQVGLNEEGIFRVAPDNRLLDECIQVINDGRIFEVDFGKYPVHVCSGVIKHFLRNLPDPLLQGNLYSDWIRLADVPPPQQLGYAKQIIGAMKPAHYHLMSELLRFLSVVASNGHANKMMFNNLSIVTAPNILRSATGGGDDLNLSQVNIANDVVSFLIQNFSSLFEANPPPSLADVLIADYVRFQKKLVGHTKSVRLICPTKKRLVWSIDSDGTVFEWTMDGEYMGNFSSGCKTPLSIEFINGNMWLGSPQGIIAISTTTKTRVAELPHFEALSLLHIAAKGLVWVGCESKILIVDTLTMSIKDTVVVPDNGIVFAMCVVGKTIWASGIVGRKGEIFVYDIETAQLISSISAHEKKINTVICIGNYVWTGSDDMSICIWDASTYVCVAKLDRHSGRVNQLCWVGDQVWSCSWDKRIIIWHAKKFTY